MFLRKTKGYFFIPQRSINKHIRWTENRSWKCKYYKIYKYKWRWASDISSEWEAEYFHAIVYRWTIPYKRRAKWIRSWWAPQLNLLYYWIICKECSVLLVDYILFVVFIDEEEFFYFNFFSNLEIPQHFSSSSLFCNFRLLGEIMRVEKFGAAWWHKCIFIVKIWLTDF